MKHQIIIKNSLGEMDIEYWSNKEYRRVLSILKQIEDTFVVDMNQYPELRKSILDTGNFIRRLPTTISECIEVKDNRSDSK